MHRTIAIFKMCLRILTSMSLRTSAVTAFDNLHNDDNNKDNQVLYKLN